MEEICHDALLKQSPKWRTLVSQLVAGGTAGLVSDLIMFPLDTVRTHVQSSKGVPRSSVLLYRGFAVTATFSIPAHAVYFSTYDRMRGTSPVAAGIIAEMTGALIFTPQEVIKKRTQLRLTGYTHATPGLLARAVLAELRRTPLRTTRDLYTGYWLSVATWGPFSAIYLAGYENLRKATDLPVFVAAGTAAVFGALLTAPLDGALTRLQTQTQSLASDGLCGILRDMAREKAWFRGAGSRAVWLGGCGAISLTIFEALVAWGDADCVVIVRRK
jgi:hypothetical protein